MKNLKCQIFGYLFIYICFMKTRTTLEDLLDYNAAEQKCKTHGGLKSNNEFKDNNGFITVNEEQIEMLNLQNGASAWISGYAEYLNFLSWYGCYEEKLPVHKKIVDVEPATFEECLHFCGLYRTEEISYVGLRNKYCFCIKEVNMQTSAVEIVNNSKCFPINPYNFECNECTVGKAISVFKIHNNLRFDQQQPVLQQCVYAERKAMSVAYKAASCYKPSSGGIICTNDAFGKLNDTCDGFHLRNEDTQTFCILHNETDWMQAKEYCSNFSGKVIVEVLPVMASEMKNGLQYCTGIFQSFKIANKSSRVKHVPTACLAVKRIHKKLVLDPDNCSVRKKYLCSKWDDISSSPTPHKMSTKGKPEYPKNANLKYAAIYIAGAVVAVSVLGIITCIIIKCSKRKNKHKRLQESMSVSVSNNECIEKTADNNESYNYAQVSQTNRTRKLKPNKPLRHTLKRQNLGSSYENFKLKSNVIGKTDEQEKTVNEDYDRIDLKSTRTKLLHGDTMNESNIYDHTTANDFEEYDTMKRSKLSQQFDSVTYNTLQKSIEDRGTKEVKNDDETLTE